MIQVGVRGRIIKWTSIDVTGACENADTGLGGGSDGPRTLKRILDEQLIGRDESPLVMGEAPCEEKERMCTIAHYEGNRYQLINWQDSIIIM